MCMFLYFVIWEFPDPQIESETIVSSIFMTDYQIPIFQSGIYTLQQQHNNKSNHENYKAICNATYSSPAPASQNLTTDVAEITPYCVSRKTSIGHLISIFQSGDL